MSGALYIGSLFFLSAVVTVVYSAAQDAYLPLRGVARQTLRRAAKLLGVLAVLAIVVHVLSRV